MSGIQSQEYYCGTAIHTPVRGQLSILESVLIGVDETGSIADMSVPNDTRYDEMMERARRSGKLTELSAGQYFLPGMIDLHIHAPQWPQLGKALHLPLEEWLQKCTFPLEAKYADLEFARTSYSSLVSALLANGTTTAVYFGSIHLEATKLLAEICVGQGQRAYIGKVAMDNDAECPSYYRDASTAQGLSETRAFIEYVKNISHDGGGLVHPVVTPRFIPSCTDDMLEGLGGLAEEYDCHVQTHCSESDWQHQYVLDRHGLRDTESLDRFGLLRRRSILAHCTFINDSDISTMKMRHSSVAHCPLSNYYFSNAVFPARRALDSGLNVGLGTDISGGPSASILNNIGIAVTSSRALEEGVNSSFQHEDRRGSGNARIDFKEAFWMATVGGAEALELRAGQFKIGYNFDAILVDIDTRHSNIIEWPDLDTPEDILQKIVYCASRENISSVWVAGRKVV